MMTAARAGACRDAGTRARAWADRHRGRVWCSRRLTRGGVHHRHAMEYSLGEDGHVTCGWSTDRNACVQHAYGWERWRSAAPASRRLRQGTAVRRRRQRRSGLRAAGPPRARVGWAGKALQNDGKYDSIQSPIVWWTHVYPRGWRAARADLWGKRTRARPQDTLAGGPGVFTILVCGLRSAGGGSCPSSLRIITSSRKPGTMPPYHAICEGGML
jgi:hypothetical protein